MKDDLTGKQESVKYQRQEGKVTGVMTEQTRKLLLINKFNQKEKNCQILKGNYFKNRISSNFYLADKKKNNCTTTANKSVRKSVNWKLSITMQWHTVQNYTSYLEIWNKSFKHKFKDHEWEVIFHIFAAASTVMNRSYGDFGSQTEVKLFDLDPFKKRSEQHK